jgi:hypothetical protein
MPAIEVSDAAHALVTGYTQLWGQTETEAVDTLIRLHNMPVHTVAAPPATTTEPNRARPDQAQR